MLTFALYSPTLCHEKQREIGVLLMVAAIVAAIRLRGEPITSSQRIQCSWPGWCGARFTESGQLRKKCTSVINANIGATA